VNFVPPDAENRTTTPPGCKHYCRDDSDAPT